MACLKPIVVNDGMDTVRCGQCLSCRNLRACCWTGRMVLEASQHACSIVRTLTYAENPGVLAYRDVQLFLKRYRKDREGIRFFVCGEHGDMFDRPHWHIVLFGSVPDGELRARLASDDVWPYGYYYDDIVSVPAFKYVTKYLFKNDKSEKITLSRMSLKPGIGLARMQELGGTFARQYNGRTPHAWPSVMLVQGHKYPIVDGALSAFKRGFVDAGGSPPVERTQLERKLDTLSLVCDWGTRIEQKRLYTTEWMLRRGELLAPSFSKS